MELSASQAAKRVGKSIPTITRAIKSGKLSAVPRDGGGWIIEASELFRVWPAISFDSDVTAKMLNRVTPLETSALEREVELLREMLEDTRADRDSWKNQAQKITALVEDQSTRKKGFWARLVGG
ncbi:helix-turn-helix domain-containing protein [uncultured Roseobacter sp.]|uniref:helix-turn-helix domain-containing protein n=1 Tax=uncultured Roseobacter sp. TaxID=114847 RepID=UPI0034524442